ncbi:putative ATP-dependent RNA helicase TDRD12 [Chionoecetes opilio]|uniref:RNA helicase n=1 Tax=Chionoecetes opilio TaxID=41210 RepID=A0A8J4XX65_CHIOP|nr:putative ATP-dependent RNA helicase TDRD12 [Chionoecetes opilio]
MNHKHTEKQHSDLTLRSEEQDKGQETEVQKCGILEGRRKDVNRTVVSASHIFNMQRLGMPPLSAVEGVTRRLRPETSWSQKEKNVHISIHLVGVEQYKCRVSTAHFIFMSVLGDKFYALDEVLCHEVITDACVVNVLGISLSITLEKAVKGRLLTFLCPALSWLYLYVENYIDDII